MVAAQRRERIGRTALSFAGGLPIFRSRGRTRRFPSGVSGGPGNCYPGGAQPQSWQLLPDGLIYRSYLAGKESRFLPVKDVAELERRRSEIELIARDRGMIPAEPAR